MGDRRWSAKKLDASTVIAIAALLGARVAIAQGPSMMPPPGAPRVGGTKPLQHDAVRVEVGAEKPDRLEAISTTTNTPTRIEWNDGRPSVVLQPNEQVVVKPIDAAPARAPLSSTKVAFPGVILSSDHAHQPGVVQSFRLFVQAEQMPMRWDESKKLYGATIIVGVDEDGATSTATKLAPPISVELIGENLQGIDPQQVTIEEVGIPGYKRVHISTAAYDASPEISAHSALGDRSFTSAVEPGLMVALSAPPRILGLGLQGTDIVVGRRASNGSPLRGEDDLTVTLTTSAGTLDPALVQIQRGATEARASLLSSSFGTATVQAHAGAAASASAAVVFAVPWSLFLSCCVGALVGGALDGLVSQTRKLRGWLKRIGGAVLAGIVVTIALAAGIKLIPWPVATTSEIAWLAAGAVGGILGPRSVRALVNKYVSAPSKA